jgi:hypothetical protein
MQEIVCPQKGNSYSVVESHEIDEELIEGVMSNNNLLFKPEFIPFYLNEVKKYNFSNTEGLVYGFIRFYLRNNPNGKFYFTNDQLAYMLDVSPSTISNSIVKVCGCGEFKVSYKVKANGGTFRLLESSESDSEKLKSLTLKKLRANNNKIKENNINIPKGIGEPAQRGNSDINECINYLEQKIGASLDGTVKENRQYCYNLLRKMKKDYPGLNPVDNIKLLIEAAIVDKFHSKNATGFKYLYYNTQKIGVSFKKRKGNNVAVIS